MKTFLTSKEVQQMTDAGKTLRDQALIALLFNTGLRITEALNLHAEDIDYENGMIQFLHLKTRRPRVFQGGKCPDCGHRMHESATACPGCGSINRPVVGPVTTASSRRRTATAVVPERQVAVKPDVLYRIILMNVSTGLLFPMNRSTAYWIVRNAAAAIGLAGKCLTHPETGRHHFPSPHRLRDAMSVRWVTRQSSMEGLIELKGQLGHKSLDTTLKYLKFSPEHRHKVHDKVWGEDVEMDQAEV